LGKEVILAIEAADFVRRFSVNEDVLADMRFLLCLRLSASIIPGTLRLIPSTISPGGVSGSERNLDV